ncbi:MAG TPA: hypothetical protein VE974_30395 [Thermoanaerobaculia bacterium]|nr:hypothetical protein [Thermoanaerobaculia bacterium]
MRDAIKRRIRETKRLLARLSLLETNAQLQLRLYICAVCGQYWQTGHEWNFGDREYIFRVPAIESSEWLREPYCQPAAMLIYSAAMENFFARNSFEDGDAPCREEACANRSMKQGFFCLDHHLEQLRAVRILPPTPPGRIFAPYSYSPGA